MKVYNQFQCQLRLEVPFVNATVIEIAHMFGKLPLSQVFVVPASAFNGIPLYNQILYNTGKYGSLEPASLTPPLQSLFDYERIDLDVNNLTITFTSRYTGLVLLLA